MAQDVTYGMGLQVDRTWGIPIVSHGGSIIGYKSNMYYLPDHDVAAGFGGLTFVLDYTRALSPSATRSTNTSTPKRRVEVAAADSVGDLLSYLNGVGLQDGVRTDEGSALDEGLRHQDTIEGIFVEGGKLLQRHYVRLCDRQDRHAVRLLLMSHDVAQRKP